MNAHAETFLEDLGMKLSVYFCILHGTVGAHTPNFYQQKQNDFEVHFLAKATSQSKDKLLSDQVQLCNAARHYVSRQRKYISIQNSLISYYINTVRVYTFIIN